MAPSFRPSHALVLLGALAALLWDPWESLAIALLLAPPRWRYPAAAHCASLATRRRIVAPLLALLIPGEPTLAGAAAGAFASIPRAPGPLRAVAPVLAAVAAGGLPALPAARARARPPHPPPPPGPAAARARPKGSAFA